MNQMTENEEKLKNEIEITTQWKKIILNKEKTLPKLRMWKNSNRYWNFMDRSGIFPSVYGLQCYAIEKRAKIEKKS